MEERLDMRPRARTAAVEGRRDALPSRVLAPAH